jgi:GAF domain-containing protein
MAALAESAAAITGSLKLEEVLQRILDQISQALRVEVVSLALIDPKQEELVFRASTSLKNQNVLGIRLKLGQGVACLVALHCKWVIVTDVSNDNRFFPGGGPNEPNFKPVRIACAPIRWRGEVIGILEALNPIEGFRARCLARAYRHWRSGRYCYTSRAAFREPPGCSPTLPRVCSKQYRSHL